MKQFLRRTSRAFLVLSISACLTITTAEPALAWGAQGHQYVGNLGGTLLNPVASAKVAALLGPNVDLGHAAVWADCIRSVSGSPATGFVFTKDQYTPAACGVFDDHGPGNTPGPEYDRMTDYARRNWTNCVYSGARTKCHQAYHFADINVHNRQKYELDYLGAGDQDVVQAIKAAITVLQCPDGNTCATPAPFNFKDKREALFLLAHFLGDVHQPLHVGAVYLNVDGTAGGDDGQPTVGGNGLLLAPGDKSNNLHHAWDTILASLKTAPSATAIASACQIAPRPNPVLQHPEDWASETVTAANTAYQGIRYRKDDTLHGSWDVTFTDATYADKRKSSQARQLVIAGARLAATLNAIWPSNARSKACGPANGNAGPRVARSHRG